MGDRTLDHPISSYTKAQQASGEQNYPRKRLIVYYDGTWNAGDAQGQPLTNVAKIVRCISDVDTWKPKGDDETKGKNFVQIVHYQLGIGTGTGWWANLRDGMFGKGEGFTNVNSVLNIDEYICRNRESYSCSLHLHLPELV
jgi:hypothetical protein